MVDQIERAEEIYKNTIYSAQIEGERIGVAKGKIEGKIEGEIEERLAIVRNMLNNNRPMDMIVEDTGFTIDEIRKLIH